MWQRDGEGLRSNWPDRQFMGSHRWLRVRGADAGGG